MFRERSQKKKIRSQVVLELVVAIKVLLIKTLVAMDSETFLRYRSGLWHIFKDQDLYFD